MGLQEILRQNKTVLLDGGMGTELAGRGCEMGGISNLDNPDTVLAIHRDYIEAGADILITNTLTMNRISLEAHGSTIDLEEVNRAGVKLARQAAADGQLVFGDIGPTGQLLEPYGSYTEEQFYDCFLEQASVLAAEGVDGLIIETITDLREAVCAMRACRKAAELPVIVTLSFSTTDKGGRTIMGSTVEQTARAAKEHGAAAVGANCGDLDPDDMAVLAGMFRQFTALPIIMQPNAGRPKLVDGTTTFDMQPVAFAEGIIKCIESGASLVGGCCGTTPDHISTVTRLMRNN